MASEVVYTDVQPPAPLSVNQLILLAYQQAGLLPFEATLRSANMVPKLEAGRRRLDLILTALPREGFVARTSVFHYLRIEAGINEYELPGNILDMGGNAMFIQGADNVEGDASDSELLVTQVDADAWHVQSTKSTESPNPLMYAVFSDGGQVRVKLWPTPSEQGLLRCKCTRLLAGAGDGKGAPDLQLYWQDWLVYALAGELAIGSGMERAQCMLLLQMAEAKKVACLRYGKEHTPQQAVVTYRSGWE
jgi:hypothetical protein